MTKRMCDSCGGVDDHPRHVVAYADNDVPTSAEVGAKALKNAGADTEAVLAQIMDVSTIMKHMDCCEADGCPDGSCGQVLAIAKNAKGAALRKALTTDKVAAIGAELNDQRASAQGEDN